MVKRFILNADGFGLSEAHNRAIYEGCAEGLLKSVSIVANGCSFDDAINIYLPKCPNIGVGINLNITEGQPLCDDLKSLTNEENNFNKSFYDILLKSYNPKEKDFLSDIEREFRRQIELVLSKTKVSHIDSRLHIHAIPKIFNLVCKLAKEYDIKQVRSHYEKPYLIPDLYKYMGKSYYLNLAKSFLLNLFTIFNESTANDIGLKTNDYIVGIAYADMMGPMAISYALSSITIENITVEAVINPCRYEDGTINNHFQEFMITKNRKLMSRINHLDYEITNYVEKD